MSFIAISEGEWPGQDVELFMKRKKLSYVHEKVDVWLSYVRRMSLDRLTRSICLLQTDRMSDKLKFV